MVLIFGVRRFLGFFGHRLFKRLVGNERRIDPRRQTRGRSGGVRACIIEFQIQPLDQFRQRGIRGFPIIHQQLAVLQRDHSLGGNAVFFPLVGRFPLRHHDLELVVASGELVIERGVEIGVGRAGDQLGKGGGPCGRIGEAFAERIIVGMERGAGEKQADEGFSHG